MSATSGRGVDGGHIRCGEEWSTRVLRNLSLAVDGVTLATASDGRSICALAPDGVASSPFTVGLAEFDFIPSTGALLLGTETWSPMWTDDWLRTTT